MKRYGKYVKPYLGAFLLGPVMMFAEVFGDILMPKLMSLIINNGVANHDIGYIIRVGLLMTVIALFMLVAGVGGTYFATRASVGFSSDLRQDLFNKVQEFSFNNIDQYSTGSLVTRLTNDIQQVQQIIMLLLRMAMRAPTMLVGALIMAFTINSQLAVVILIMIPTLVIAIAIIMYLAYPRFGIMQNKLDLLNTNIQEALTNVRVIKSFVREDYEIKRFAKGNRDLKESSLGAMKIVITLMPIMLLAMHITTIAVVWFGGNMIIAGEMPVGDLTAFTTYIVQIMISLMLLSMVFFQSSRAAASVKRINEVLQTDIDLNDDHAARKTQKVEHGKIEFKDVSFGYHDKLVLENISFTAEPGQVVGIIGATGSGKTSLVQLIPRLYEATTGEVLVDGINVKDYSLHNLRDGVGMVLQQNVLFSGTIEENLRWGAEDAAIEEVQAAADAAQAHGFITSFTEGYETDMGQGGVNVSGGQKQRLCIARALLKNPKILILDDSTSAVDTATEAKIRESFHTTLKSTTKIVIAQRIGSVEEADKILVLDHGTIIGTGTHEELMKNCEAYQEIYYSQRDHEEESVSPEPVLEPKETSSDLQSAERKEVTE